MTKQAFTLIELILYIGIVAVVATVLLLFSVNLAESQNDNDSVRELTENARAIMSTLEREIRDAAGVDDIVSNFTGSIDTLALDQDSGPDVVFNTTTDSDGRYIQIDGERMSSPQVDVTRFDLTDVTRGSNPSSIRIDLELTSNIDSRVFDLQTTLTQRR